MTTTMNEPFLDAAYRIGTRICRDAVWAGRKCNWVGPSMEHIEGEWKVVHRAYPTDVYSGTAGIGFFLSHLYARCGDPVLKDVALGCFAQAIANAEQMAPGARIGFYTGWSGLAFVLQEVGPLLGTDALAGPAAQFLAGLEGCVLAESGIDVLAGSAGAIPVLLSRGAGQEGGMPRAGMTLARKIGDHLIGIAHKNGRGWSWNTLDPRSADGSANLTGFSHGSAGIAWALAELSRAGGGEEYISAARQAFAYERQLFSQEFSNWPDLRSNDGGNGKKDAATLYGTVAWCHGAPGIGLSRLRVYDLVSDEVCKQEAAIAVTTTYTSVRQALEGGQGNFSLCHGMAGNSELLLMAADSFHNPGLLDFVRHVGMVGIERYVRKGEPWPCGVMGAGETPGLMLGMSGIGYFYLRLADPGGVPSILIPVPRW
jgi:lantibiotic modifying enzyme